MQNGFLQSALIMVFGMKQYIDFAKHVRQNGEFKADRTGTGTTSVFGYQMRHNLLDGFPLLTTKKVHLKSIIHELLWFLSGNTNVKYLQEHGVSIWDEWALENGDLGPVYGKQWVSWPIRLKITEEDIVEASKDISQFGATSALDYLEDDINQIEILIDGLKNKPNSRRHIVTAWNPEFLPNESISPKDNVKLGKMALPPCHLLMQFYVSNDSPLKDRIKYCLAIGRLDLVNKLDENPYRYNDELSHAFLTDAGIPTRKLSCQMYQRSADIFLGVPYNIASYSILTMMLAHICGYMYGDFIHTFGDAHIYRNHHTQILEQCSREPHPLPTLKINYRGQSYNEFKYEDFELLNYRHHPAIRAEIAV